MCKCCICNDFQPGQGTEYPVAAWLANLLASSCPYCKLVVEAIQALEPEFFEDNYEWNWMGFSQEVNVVLQLHVDENHGPDYVFIQSAGNGRSTLEMGLDIFRSSDHELRAEGLDSARFPVRREIALVPGERLMWDFVRSSLRTCLTEHPKCAEAQNPSWFPERLLCLEPNSGGQSSVRLVETRDQISGGSWIALSHCWGSERFTCTTTKNIHTHKKMIDLSTLPPTFQDAVIVARELGVSYLWIDSLCIIQDDQDDWAGHAEHMDQIYENALLVVAAVSSNNGSVPFLGAEAPSARSYYHSVGIGPKVPDASDDGEPISCLRARRGEVRLSPTWIDGPLESRAWAWQERHCAVRILSFTDVEAKWRCKVTVACECQYEDNAYEWRNEDEANLKNWHSWVWEYSKRDLTYETDRLPAIASVASRLHAVLQSNYLAGLWEEELPFNLGWYRQELTDAPSMSPLIKPATGNGVPSWSWASNALQSTRIWNYAWLPGSMELVPEPRLESKVDILDIDCIPSTANKFGAVQTGSFIKLRAHVVEAVMYYDDYGSASVCREGFNAQVVFPDCKISLDADSSRTKAHNNLRRDPSSFLGDLDDTHMDSATNEKYHCPSTRSFGTVYCLLLFTGTHLGQIGACVLVLGQVLDEGELRYQRLGLGATSLKHCSGPLYGGRETWKAWQGWGSLEEWSKWEKWFANTELEVITIV
ncbi:hypothetical protein AA0120_g7212 [Alternaria tenuissima]|jgi:hypothetical protein|nr:hypothetical protein AA0120_g7212 [Alternaria tenuissima]